MQVMADKKLQLQEQLQSTGLLQILKVREVLRDWWLFMEMEYMILDFRI